MLATWDSTRIIIFLIPFLLLAAGVVAVLILRSTFRSRFRIEKQLRDDPDIDEWLIVYPWSRKVLYFPTILASFAAAAAAAFIKPGNSYEPLVGGIWLSVFFLNFLIDEYEINLKVLFIVILGVVAMCLWLSLMGWMRQFLDLRRFLHISMNSTAYLLIGLILLLAIFISWVRGLFYYVAITPNYLNIQGGPTETGEQISREEYSTRIDTGDFLERLLGFGRVVITFHEPRRLPSMMLTGRIGKKAAKLESIRGTLIVDRSQKKAPAESE